MAGYILAKFFNGSIAAGSTVTLLTVPAGHRYLIKQASSRIDHNASAQDTYLRANGRTVAYYRNNGGGERVCNFCAESKEASSGADDMAGGADNLVLEAGDTLSIVNPSSNAGTMVVSGIDYTE
jgi:hypothetical protein